MSHYALQFLTNASLKISNDTSASLISMYQNVRGRVHRFRQSSAAFVSAFSPVDKPVDDTNVRPSLPIRARYYGWVLCRSSPFSRSLVEIKIADVTRTANVTGEPRQRFIVGLFGEFACIVRWRATEISHEPGRTPLSRSSPSRSTQCPPWPVLFNVRMAIPT